MSQSFMSHIFINFATFIIAIQIRNSHFATFIIKILGKNCIIYVAKVYVAIIYVRNNLGP